jgi:1-acyl-sn-glycerol-3-phosphate acyltransferase
MAPVEPTRPETFEEARDRLSRVERFSILCVKKTFQVSLLDRFFLWCQRVPGRFWVDKCTRNLRSVYGLDRLGPLDQKKSVILVTNHRSFFDMFVVCMLLYVNGFNLRLFFPVRASFFYDHPLGLFVNGIMSWFSMYPPIFRDRKRATLNHTAFSELAAAVQQGRSAGIHPEGTRKKDDDPYTFLPAAAGVGRLIHLARCEVIPAFVNGLGNNLWKQVLGNFTRKGPRIIVVFGEPIDFEGLLDQPPTAKTFRAIAERTLEVIGALGQEEKAIRASMDGESSTR